MTPQKITSLAGLFGKESHFAHTQHWCTGGVWLVQLHFKIVLQGVVTNMAGSASHVDNELYKQ